jgi:hypothetical protein
VLLPAQKKFSIELTKLNAARAKKNQDIELALTAKHNR